MNELYTHSKEQQAVANAPLDTRIQVGVKLEWCKGKASLCGKAEVVSLDEGSRFTVKWDDGRVMSEYGNLDLEVNGGDFTVEVAGV